MKRSILFILFFNVTLLGAQEAIQKYQDLCSRSFIDKPSIPSPAPLKDSRRVPTSCLKSEASDFAILTAQELFDYLIEVDDPYTCVNRILYGFHSEYSPSIFEDAKVRFVAEQTSILAQSFDGINDNGVHAAYTYLSIAGLHATFYSSHISLESDTWNAIQNACLSFANNEDISLDHEVSLYTMGHMFFAASFDSVGVDSVILASAKAVLDDLANDGYVGQTDLYPYYYCLYYILDVYFRYPTDIMDFISITANQDEVIGTLADVATNLNINANTFIHFEDLSHFGVTAITRYAPHEILQDAVEPALLEITETYPVDDSRWVESALSLVQNDMEFHLSEEEILGSLSHTLFPNQYSFDDGKIIINTPLEYEEILPLYQGAIEVKSQFFRMLGSEAAVLADTNEVLTVQLYGNRDDYRNFNNLLFGVNYPNSGGVYIERYSTFYTYQRTPQESSYSMEALFRHEYTHYLQGRYIVEGEWGRSPAYDNSRLVWFEEGMAQFFSGSTRTSNVKALSLIKNTIQNSGSIQNLESVLSSSYSTGNPDAYYIYGAMFWTHLYYNDRSTFLEFVDLVLNNDFTGFDALVEYYKTSTEEDIQYLNFVDSLLLQSDIWIDPQSPVVHPNDIDPYDVNTLAIEMAQIIPAIDIEVTDVSVEDRPRRFKISGELSIDNPENMIHINEAINERLNIYLNNFELSNYNNFHYATAYFTNLVEDLSTGDATASFHIVGPLNDFCQTLDIEDISFQQFPDYVVFYPPNELVEEHQFRYRELGSEEWVMMDISSELQDTLNLSDTTNGFEFQLRYECSPESWSDYSVSQVFHLCPVEQNIETEISEHSIFSAATNITSSSVVLNDVNVEFLAGQSIELHHNFEVKIGSSLVINNKDCSSSQ